VDTSVHKLHAFVRTSVGERQLLSGRAVRVGVSFAVGATGCRLLLGLPPLLQQRLQLALRLVKQKLQLLYIDRRAVWSTGRPKS
jgi:hypothetical protein